MSWLPANARHVGGNEYLLVCPAPSCRKEKLAWNAKKVFGWCLVCGFRINGLEQLKRHFPTGSSVPLHVDFRTPLDGYGVIDPYSHPGASAYLEERGVIPDDIYQCNCTYGEGRVWFPVWSPLGLQPFCLGRSIDPRNKLRWLSYPAEKGKYLFGKLPVGETVILVEGIFKVLTPHLWGRALAVLGSAPSLDILVWLGLRYKDIIVWFDPDAAGLKGASMVSSMLNGWLPDVTVCVLKGPAPDECSPEYALSELERLYPTC